MFDLSHVNIWAVLVAALANMAIGFFWYSKAAFGTAWTKLDGRNFDEISNPNPAIYLVNLAAYLVMAYVLAQVVYFFGASTVFAGAILGLVMWLGFVGPTTFIESMFAGRSWKLYAINFSYPLVALIVMASILAIWQ